MYWFFINSIVNPLIECTPPFRILRPYLSVYSPRTMCSRAFIKIQGGAIPCVQGAGENKFQQKAIFIISQGVSFVWFCHHVLLIFLYWEVALRAKSIACVIILTIKSTHRVFRKNQLTILEGYDKTVILEGYKSVHPRQIYVIGVSLPESVMLTIILDRLGTGEPTRL